MAVLRRRESSAPEHLARFYPAYWGRTEEGVRAWKRAALEWLAADRDRQLPLGEHGDPVDVIRECIRLIEAL